jgi:amino acid adenylation domain-containing protein
MAGWNDTRHPYPDDAVVHVLFDAQADRTPDRTALVFGDERLTFATLQRRSNQLAHHLIERGVTQGTSVGVAMHRSPDMVVGMLAILKAGGAYLPLDPAYPQDRLALMIEDADVGLILTDPDVVGFPESRAQMIDVRGYDESAYPSDPPPNRATPDDTMFVIFTSGSTGRPKGVLGTHRGMLNRFAWQWQTYPFADGEVCCGKTSLNFVDHVWETWGPLLKGHTLVLVPDAIVHDAARFVDLLAEHRIQRLVTVPSLMSTLLRSVPDIASRLSHLRFCTLSGERLPMDLAAEFSAALPGTVLLNLYGMSEGSADATWYDQRWPTTSDTFPIGRPIHNMRVYLLDEERRPVPIGATGEVYLAGVGLAKGYVARPDLTAERFLDDPFDESPGARMYRSGDLARWLPEGVLEFVGRVDHQVKVRGIRIEPGEIEATARSIDGVEDVVVTAHEMGQDRQLVAYVTLGGTHAPTPTRIRDQLAARLPEYMVPGRVLVLDTIPRTPHGKVDRQALPDPVGTRPASDTPYAPPRTTLERELARLWEELLLIDRVGVNDSFFDLGGDSLLVIRLQAVLNETFQTDLVAPDIYATRTIRDLAALIEERRGGPPADAQPRPVRRRGSPRSATGTDVAIIGMAGRFPGAADLDRFWRHLADGVEGLRRMTDEELRMFEPDHELKSRDPDFVPIIGTLDDVEMFDAEFFGLGPGEARTLDPQHRIWFETAWQALESAGYAPGKVDHRIGVFAGSYMNTYTMYNLLHDRAAVEAFVRMQDPASYLQMLNNDRDYLPTRTSHLLDLRGPAVNVQTACSTSLVAVVLACRAIASGDCEMALAGGVSVFLPQAQGYFYQEGGIRSADGHTRPFDAAGTGTVFTSGVGAVLLKGLDQALVDGDTIHAVIRGAAMNNDGAHKASYMAPSIDGQAEVIADALDRAGLEPGAISYVEAHGTATPLGDPMEVAALTRVFGHASDEPRQVALGAVKSNIGHSDAAAGVAGLIKTVLSLEHEAIPPTLHFETPNPQIDFEASPFHVVQRLESWPRGPEPRRAGVSSFGVGGTNAHVVLEEAPAVPLAPSSRPRHLLPLSARSVTALASMRRALADHLERTRPPLADVAHTLAVGRTDFAHRTSVVAADVDEAIAALRSDRVASSELLVDAPDVVMMFPGQGAQYVRMGQELYEHESVFRDAFDTCARVLGSSLHIDLRELLYPVDGSEADATERLTRTALAQPALFAVSYATASLWRSWGVEPSALVGHSVGEYVAAAVAGVFSLEDTLRIVAERGRLMQALPGGSMLAVRLSAEELQPYLGDGVGLAAINTPQVSVVSGPDDAMGRLVARLEADGLDTIALHTSHAFHSQMIEPMLDQLRAVVAGVERHPPRIPIVSTSTGEVLTDEQALDPAYWADQARRPVLFSAAVRTLHQEPHRVYLEVGPGRTLTGAVLQHPEGPDGAARIAVVQSLSHPTERRPALGSMLTALGQLWQAGLPVSLDGVYRHERRRRVPLPTYPFERQRHWVDPPPLARSAEPLEAPRPFPRTTGDTISTGSAAQGSALPQAASEPTPRPAAGHEVIADGLVAILARLGGVEPASLDRSAAFTELGFDSLALTAANAQFRKRFGVRITLGQLLDETPTIDALASYVAERTGATAVLPVDPGAAGDGRALEAAGSPERG